MVQGLGVVFIGNVFFIFDLFILFLILIFRAYHLIISDIIHDIHLYRIMAVIDFIIIRQFVNLPTNG